ncbi:MAG TPA: GNAT family protein [Actinomycetes bacterium]|nr:GNAT family protein [Actinomycetes bacterium]
MGLRPIRHRDVRRWRAIRSSSAEWLRPWEATAPFGHQPPLGFHAMVRALHRDARAGRVLPFVVTFDDVVVGQLTIGGVQYGSLRGAHIGYWVAQDFAGRGIIPIALALATDHAFQGLRLHRVEVSMRPENGPSRRVAEKLDFRFEGERRRYLHIDGEWRDHLVYVLLAEDMPEGVLERWHRAQG